MNMSVLHCLQPTRLRRLVCGALLAGPMAVAASASVPAPPHGNAERLINAVKAQRIGTVRALIVAGADVDSVAAGDGTALIVAARAGDAALVDELLRLGADVNRAARGDGNPLIAAAAVAGNLPVVDRLVTAGARVDAVVVDDETPLINAARSADLQTVTYLVEHGADVNLGVMVDTAPHGVPKARVWRSPLNQAHNDAIRHYLLRKGARR